jgi:hypothetical protein
LKDSTVSYSRKPRKFWHWLLLLTPALELMTLPFVADRWGAWLFRFRDTPFLGLFVDRDIPGLGVLVDNLVVVAMLCMALGLWQAWPGRTWPDRIKGALISGFAIAIINGTIAFAGCGATVVLNTL